MDTNSTVATPPLEIDETLDLMEAHHRLLEFHGYAVAQEQDTFSLAQPSPFRYVPSVALTGSGPMM